MSIRLLLKSVTPPLISDWVRKVIQNKYFIRGFKSWDAALKKSSSYNTEEVFNKTVDSARLVRDGEAIYERDSVIFDEIQYDWQLLTSLLFVASVENRLNIVDFGGALGTSYRQNKKYLDEIPTSVKWGIIEQSEFVNIGRNEFQTDVLYFYDSLTSIDFDVDIVLMASSICYLESPYTVLDEIKTLKPKFILIVRTPFSNFQNDEISLQIVPNHIYSASYPIWTFSESNFTTYLSDMYEVFNHWEDGLQADPNATAKGILFKLISC